jgi:hypothetical protein
MPNIEFTSTIYISFLIILFFTSSLKQLEIRFNEAFAGNIYFVGLKEIEFINYVYSRPKLPTWIHFIFILDWLIVLILLILNWKITIIVLIIKWLITFVPLLETFGNILLLPFQKRYPKDVSDEHFKIAVAIRQLDDCPTENKEAFDFYYENIQSLIEKIEGNDEDFYKIKSALHYLNADKPLTIENAWEYCQQRNKNYKYSL